MSAACRSWEVASGLTVGFNMAVQSAANADTLLSESANYCSNTALSHDSLVKTVVASTDGLIFPNHKALSPQDTVTRGLSSLSLHPHSQLLARNPTTDYHAHSYESNNKSLELNPSIPVASNGTNFCCFAAYSAEYNADANATGPQNVFHHGSNGSKAFEGVTCCVSALLPLSSSLNMQGSVSPNSFWVATRNSVPFQPNYRDSEFHDFPKRTLGVVVEDKPFEENFALEENGELEDDVLSLSTTNSVASVIDGAVLMSDKNHADEDSEAQSPFKGSPIFEESSSPRRKGLSRFYTGKSRSYSCLGDVTSVRDLVKPENPYAKKRRCLTGSGLNICHSQHAPLQRGSASISKKGLQSEKSTLALAVAMSMAEDGFESEDSRKSFAAGQSCRPKRPLTSRSFSLSDFQRVSQC